MKSFNPGPVSWFVRCICRCHVRRIFSILLFDTHAGRFEFLIGELWTATRCHWLLSTHNRTIPDALNMQKPSVSRKILHRRQETVNFFFPELSPYHWVILSFPTSCNLSSLWAFYYFAVALLCCFAIFTHCKQSDGWGAVNIPWHLSWCQPSGRPLFPVLTTKLTQKTSENVRCLCCCVAAKTVW
jgi:hypothetical protein